MIWLRESNAGNAGNAQELINDGRPCLYLDTAMARMVC